MSRPKKESCRWWDCCMDCCRNLHTHPSIMNLMFCGEIVKMRIEPGCSYHKRCGYEKCDAEHPMWNAGNDEFGGEE